MDEKTMRFNLIQILIGHKDYSSRTVEELMLDAQKLQNYVTMGGQPDPRVLN